MTSFVEGRRLRWVVVREAPCAWCEFWIGPHQHSMLPNGTMSTLIISCQDEEDLPEEQ